MQIDKSRILELLRSQGNHDKAGQAESQLPEQVDTERDSGLLGNLGLDPQMLIGLLTKGGGGGGLGGITKGLGGMLGGR